VPSPQERGHSRRTVLRAGLIGGAAGAAALPVVLNGCSAGQAPSAAIPVDVVGYQDSELNHGWLFGGQYVIGSESQTYDDHAFQEVTLPHTVVPLSWHDWEPADWQGIWIYRRHLDTAAVPDGARVLLQFDGVMVNAAVLVNGTVVARHAGGYLPFVAEVTQHLTSDDNVLAVIVDSRCLAVPPIGDKCGPGSIDFLQPGGIYRDVWLRVVPQVFIKDVFALPRDVMTSPSLQVQCTLDAAADVKDPVNLTITLQDGQNPVASVSARVTSIRRGSHAVTLTLTGLQPITLWSTTNPKLYTVRATLDGSWGTHSFETRTGFRDARFTTDGFFLNGERLKLFGLNRHQLFPYTGMAMPARAQRRDAEILKSDFNCNMVRCSHYPQSPHFLDACDELGLLVWQEAPGWHYVGDRAWQDVSVRNVRDMVMRDRSRPSVITWGTRLNETANYPAFYRSTRATARALDSSRPSTGAMNYHALVNWDEDIYSYNDYAPYRGDVVLAPPLPGVPYLVSEAVGVLDLVPGHFRWTDSAANLAKQAVMHAQAHSDAAANPKFSGLLGWCAFDYASLRTSTRDALKTPGIADTFRVPKPGAAIYQSQADPSQRPVVVPVLDWDFHHQAPPAQANKPNVMIATNCDRVEVVAAPGTAVTTVHGPAKQFGHLAYPPVFATVTSPDGTAPLRELTVTGYVGGRLVTQVQMSSDPAGFHLVMAADDAQIANDGADVTRVVFRAVDRFGTQVRYTTGDVQLRVEGPGTLIGDNPFPLGEYGGLGAVWVRSLTDPGTITLTATHPALGTARLTIESSLVSTGSAELN
jgi:beta-galactosidase